MAQRTDAPILPYAIVSAPRKRLNTWDGFRIPYPFTRGALVFGEAVIPSKYDDREALRQTVRTIGLQAPVPGGRSLQDFGKDVLDIARAGLRSRAKLSVSGDDETGFLQELDRTLSTGKTPADELLESYNNDWQQDVSQVFKALAY